MRAVLVLVLLSARGVFAQTVTTATTTTTTTFPVPYADQGAWEMTTTGGDASSSDTACAPDTYSLISVPVLIGDSAMTLGFCARPPSEDPLCTCVAKNACGMSAVGLFHEGIFEPTATVSTPRLDETWYYRIIFRSDDDADIEISSLRNSHGTACLVHWYGTLARP